MIPVTGMCRFCGQNIIVDALEGETDEEIEERATMQCKCFRAYEYQKGMAREIAIESDIMSAKGTTFELFHEDYPEVEEMLNNALQPLTQGAFKKIAIDTGEGVKGTAGFNGIDIEVTRSEGKRIQRRTEI